MSSLKKFVGFLITLNLVWTCGVHLANKFSQKTVIETLEIEKINTVENEIIYINGVKCYRPKNTP